MESFITYCFLGFISFDENFNLVQFIPFEKEKIASKMIDLEKIREIGNIHDEGPFYEEKKIIEEIPQEYAVINIESNRKNSDYKSLSNYEKIKISSVNEGGEYLRSNFQKILEIICSQSEIKEDEKLNKEIINKYIEIASLKVKEISQEEDKLVIQAINSIDEIDESLSKLIEKIRDWNSIYFPEIDIIQNNETYIKLIVEYENRDEILKNPPESFQNNRNRHINTDIININSEKDEANNDKQEILESNGADIKEEDIEIIKNFAKSIKSLQESRTAIEKYIDKKMENIAPNLRELLGSSLGAKLISHAGGLKNLAIYPSSTVQILGAEKALFRHLKTGERPPKHGLIFQHPEIRTAPWWIRGKIARTLGLKISLAVRKDYFTKNFDKTINESFLEKVETIKKENPFPKKTRKRIEEERTGKRTSNFSNKPKMKFKKNKNKKNKKRKKKKSRKKK